MQKVDRLHKILHTCTDMNVENRTWSNRVANKFNDVIIPPFGPKEYLRKALRNAKRAALLTPKVGNMIRTTLIVS